MDTKCICQHSLQNWTSWCCQFRDFGVGIWWSTSSRVEKTGDEDVWGGYGVIYGRGKSSIPCLAAATNFLQVFNVSATVARQRSWVQLELSDMRLAVNMTNMANHGLCAPQYGKCNSWSRNLMPKSGKRSSWELSFLSIEMWRLRYKDTWQWFVKIILTAACRAKKAQHRISRHAGCANEWVHLNQNRHDLRPEPHLFQLVTIVELKVSKWKVCHPDMCIYILLFPMLNLSVLMHMPRIASVIKISFQSCCLMKEHPLVSTQSAVW